MQDVARVLLISNDETLRALLADFYSRECGLALVCADAPQPVEILLVDVRDAQEAAQAKQWLSAQSGMAFMPSGMELGAGFDQLTKPFSLKELAIRIARLSAQKTARPLADGVSWDGLRRLLITAQGEAPLTEREASLLEILVEAGPRGLDRAELMKRVWSYAENADSHTLETHIYRLRTKLKAAGIEEKMTNTPEGYAWK